MNNVTQKNIYQFKITLLGIEPEIWRRVQVSESYTFWDLHVALQEAMGWCDYHLHEFRLRDSGVKVVIGIPDDSGFEQYEDTNPGWEVGIKEYFHNKGDSAQYIYDFGDDWQHRLELEKITPKQKYARYPKCIDGERSCPPEDCGGIPGYEDLLDIIADPNHEEYESMKIWLSGHVKKYWPYKPDHFDPNKVKFDNPELRWKVAFTQHH